MSDQHLAELMRQCATHTPLGRLNQTEQERVFAWLIDGGHMTRTGQPLERPRQALKPRAYTTAGKPIFDPGADRRSTETVTMGKGNG